MSKFTRPGLLFIGSMAALCGALLWRRRNIKRAVSSIEYDGRLLIASARVTENIRSLLDVEQILKVAIEEAVAALSCRALYYTD